MLGDPITIVVLLILGFLMVFLEIAVIPGFGIPGIAGAILLGAGTVGTWIHHGALAGSLTLLGSVVISVAITWAFFRSKSAERLVIKDKIIGDSSDIPKLTFLLGMEGEALSPLRPAGIAMIGKERYDVVAEGAYLAKGTKITVVRLSTNSIVVAALQQSNQLEKGETDV